MFLNGYKVPILLPALVLLKVLCANEWTQKRAILQVFGVCLIQPSQILQVTLECSLKLKCFQFFKTSSII